jgi:hypothetical protein
MNIFIYLYIHVLMSTSITKFKFKTVSIFSTKHVENLARAISCTLKSTLGISTTQLVVGRSINIYDCQTNASNPDEFIFILIPHLLVSCVSTLPPPGKYVLYQLEQLNDKGAGNAHPPLSFNALLCRLIQNSFVTFDYSHVNLKYYPEPLRNKVRVLIPPILNIHENSSIIKNRKAEHEGDIDVLFYGSPNSRRNIILGKLKTHLEPRGYNMVSVTGIFGKDLVELISKSKVVLNIHFYENSIFENERVHSALRFPRVRVVSERATEADDAMDPIYASHPHIYFCDEIRNYSTIEVANNVNIVEGLLKMCLIALTSWKLDTTTTNALAANEKINGLTRDELNYSFRTED